jgi:hypothetical protein
MKLRLELGSVVIGTMRTLSIVTFSIMTVSIMDLLETFSITKPSIIHLVVKL